MKIMKFIDRDVFAAMTVLVTVIAVIVMLAASLI